MVGWRGGRGRWGVRRVCCEVGNGDMGLRVEDLRSEDAVGLVH